ncbi:hypothetical protein BLNAU_20154 [Blattamonas nauphoetae]|uniref:Right handed beta helix domain-containing protein n=1 Tax=Blattamonas nauphoetae TaxID=2049346 RepID=A0ABQ9WZF6_9EUKA|nr:hypothetical protein BLNAU_20154 [Blattamonas nauphoetae]
MTSLVSFNSTVHVSFYKSNVSVLTVEKQNEVFIKQQNATLSFTNVRFSFDELTAPAFLCDKDSSLTLTDTSFNHTTPALTSPFIDSVGPLVFVKNLVFLQPIALDTTPFIRLVRAEKDASFSYLDTATLLAGPLNTPFIVCEGATTFTMDNLKLNSSFLNSASFISAKDFTITLKLNQIQLLSTANGAFLNLEDGSVRIQIDTCQSCSGVQGGLVHCRNSNVTAENWRPSSCSAAKGGVLYARDSNVKFSSGNFSNCHADEGGVAYIIASQATISMISLVSNSAKRGGVFWVDFGTNSALSVSLRSSTVTTNSASDVDERGIDFGKGGVIFVKGTTSSPNPLNLNGSHFEENTAEYGNDVFVEETVLGETGSDLLKSCGGDSYSRFPHLEIENHNGDKDELARISHFISYPTLRIATSASSQGVDTCRWTGQYCKTLVYALHYLQTTAPNGSLFQRQFLNATGYLMYSLSLSADYKTKEGVVFTIDDESRLTVVKVKFSLTPLHQVMKVSSKDGQVSMQDCVVYSESDVTISKSPIFSVGSSLILNYTKFSPTLTTSITTISVPLVHFTPTPSGEDELGSGSCHINNCSLTNLTLKGQSFKQQIQPSHWQSNLNPTDLSYFVGEDVSMDESDKWRTGSLVYWIISPSLDVLIDSDENAVDHPNCGSSTFKCTTLDSAFKSAGLNELSTLSLSCIQTSALPLPESAIEIMNEEKKRYLSEFRACSDGPCPSRVETFDSRGFHRSLAQPS